jgi:hypothetical protein
MRRVELGGECGSRVEGQGRGWGWVEVMLFCGCHGGRTGERQLEGFGGWEGDCSGKRT